MSAYYNEIDPNAAQWLRELIKAGHIAPGDVDERSIEDVRPDDLRGYVQCHFFAGIGIWSHALRLAGWPDDRPVWTGSCPCQPFSAAGKGAGFDDERHLWPAWFHLISQCRPERVYGEQVASRDGLAWLDLVSSDLEAAEYALGAVDLCAAGVGAPHIRQRLWFYARRVGDAHDPRLEGLGGGLEAPAGRVGTVRPAAAPGESGRLADADGGHACAEGLQRGGQHGQQPQDRGARGMADSNGPRLLPSPQRGVYRREESTRPRDGEPQRPSAAGRLADDSSDGRRQEREDGRGELAGDQAQGIAAGLGAGGGDLRPGPVNGHWRDADWLACRDGKWRPVEPGTFPLAHGVAGRVGLLRGYGNGIVAQAAEQVIRSTM